MFNLIYIISLFIFAEALIRIDDGVSKLPGWGDQYTGKMYAGYISVNTTCNSALFYWMLEKEGGSVEGKTPVLLWLNGGPGASSITGLLAENIGPYQLSGTTFTYNEHAWTDKYNVLIIDNPVGSGYSATEDIAVCYSSTEREVAANFYIALNSFFNVLHTEYKRNPFWLTGESYAGKYIPNIAEYLHEKGFPFKGVVLGNGLYEPELQYLTVPQYALNFAIIDEETFFEMEGLANNCSNLIRNGDPAVASDYCEGMVGTIYDDIGGGVFRYDVRTFYNVFANVTTDLGKYLNSENVKKALHTEGHIWTQADETGPVADALRADFVTTVVPQLEVLLDAGYDVILYNGQMDGSVCNHVGNGFMLDDIYWSGREEFKNITQKIWRVDTEDVVGYRRVYKNLAFVVIVNAGHLVPMNQPENYRLFLDTAILRRHE